MRDWLFVDDHARALLTVLGSGRVGETYVIGGRSERKNIDVVNEIVHIVDELVPDKRGSRERLIEFVTDRPGHDLRYAIDPAKIGDELGWRPLQSFDRGIRETVSWYLENEWWWSRVLSGEYRMARLGLGIDISGDAS